MASSLSRSALLAAFIVVFAAAPARAAVVIVDCSGATPGAFASIGAALATLAPAGPHTIRVSGTCAENVQLTDRTDLVIQGVGAATLQAASSAIPALTAQRSRGIQILDIAIAGEVRLEDTQANVRGRIEHSPRNGLIVAGSSTVRLLAPTVVSGSAFAGILVEPASSLTVLGGLTVEDNAGVGIRASGVLRLFTFIADNLIQRNGAGVDLTNGANLTTTGRSSILDNGAFGMQIALAASATFGAAQTPAGPRGVIVEGNATYGLSVAGSAAVSMSGPHRIARNGTTSAEGGGVRVGSTSRVQFNNGVEIVDNIGPGLVAEWNAGAFFADTTVSGNTEEGIRITRGSVAQVDGGTVIGGNGGGPLTCDTTALVVGAAPELAGVHPNRCGRIEREHGKPRPGVVK